jgi:cytochrome c-type biogenesis protein CcmF
VAHIGIALFILGVIGSSVNSQQEDVDLVKNETISAFGYDLTFTGWIPIDNNTKYSFNIDVKSGDSEYKVKPVMYVSDFNNSLMRIPAILTLPSQDLYIAPLGYDEAKHNHSHDGTRVSLKKGSSTEFNGVNITFTKFNLGEGTMAAMQEGRDFQMGAVLSMEKDGKVKEIELLRKQISNKVEFTTFESEEFDIKLKLASLTADNVEIALSKIAEVVEEQIEEKQEVLYVSASIKPFINFVWIGVAVMVVGFFISVMRRLQETLSR